MLVNIGPFSVGDQSPHFLIAGPCVIENEKIVLETAAAIAEITADLNIPYVFKSSYDKANRPLLLPIGVWELPRECEY